MYNNFCVKDIADANNVYWQRCIRIKEKYSRGRRGAPAKGVGRVTGARVQIPLSPFPLPMSSSAEASSRFNASVFLPEAEKLWRHKSTLNVGMVQEKSVDKHKCHMVLWNSTAENIPVEKIEKSCWQIGKHMISYQSCRWRQRADRKENSSGMSEIQKCTLTNKQ